MNTTKWDRSLKTSKREQGVGTKNQEALRTRRKGRKFRNVERPRNPAYDKMLEEATASKEAARVAKSKKLV